LVLLVVDARGSTEHTRCSPGTGTQSQTESRLAGVSTLARVSTGLEQGEAATCRGYAALSLCSGTQHQRRATVAANVVGVGGGIQEDLN
jgi:hypothetical protein